MFQTNWYRTIAAAAVVLVTVGMCRLGFSAWIPVILHNNWANAHTAGYIGTAISVGAFIGLFLTHPLAIRLGQERLMRIALIMSIILLGLEIWLPGHDPTSKIPPTLDSFSFWWLAILRLFGGIAASFGFMIAPAYVGKVVAPQNRTAAIGIAVAGAGIGVIIVSFLMPVAITIPGLSPAQGGMVMTTALTVIFSIIAWPAFTKKKEELTTTPAPEPAIGKIFHLPFILLAIGLIFLLMGTMPIMVLAAAYLHLDKHLSVAASSMTIAALGLGAALGGPIMNVLVARFIGLRWTSIISASLGILACIAMALNLPVPIIIVSVCIIGGVAFGHSAISSARCLELTGPEGHLKTWSYCGIGMGIGSVAGTFASSAMLQAKISFTYIFLMCAIALAVLLVTHGLAKTAQK